MALNSTTIIDAVRSHAASLGQFRRLTAHEPKNAPGNGLTWAVWSDKIQPVLSSGLNITSVRMVLMIRIYQPMLAEPQDEIDPRILEAVDALMGAYCNDFTLGGLIRHVDIFGAEAGQGLQATAGYLNQDHKLYRVVTIQLPLVINDVWEQNP